MTLTQFNLNLLTTFDAIYSENNLTRAAQKLHVTQPAISRALQKLREQFDDPLFIRQGVKMVPTPRARSIIGQVREGLQTLESGLLERRFDPVNAARLFRLGMRENMEVLILPSLLHRIGQAGRGISISSVHIDRRQIGSALSDGVVDVIIDIMVPHGKNIQRTEAYSGSRVVVANKNHPAINGKLDLETYLSQSHILVSQSHRDNGVGCEDIELKRQGKERVIAVRCQHLSTACRIVSETDLLLTMLKPRGCSESDPFENRIYPFPCPATLKYYLYWHANAAADPAIRWLREQVKRALAEPSKEKPIPSVVATSRESGRLRQRSMG